MPYDTSSWSLSVKVANKRNTNALSYLYPISYRKMRSDSNQNYLQVMRYQYKATHQFWNWFFQWKPRLLTTIWMYRQMDKVIPIYHWGYNYTWNYAIIQLSQKNAGNIHLEYKMDFQSQKYTCTCIINMS